MKNLNIGKKFLVTFAAIIALFFFTVVLALLSLRSTISNLTFFYESPYRVTNSAMDARQAIQSAAKYLGYATMTLDSAQTADYAVAAEEEIAALKKQIEFFKQNFTGDQALVTTLEQQVNTASEAFTQVLSLARKNMNTQAASLYFSEAQPDLIRALDSLVAIYDQAALQAENNFTSSANAANLTTAFLLLLSVVTLVATIVLAMYLTRSMTKPILELEAAANEMAQGSLSVELEYESKDELGGLANSMRELTRGLTQIIADIGSILADLSKGNFKITSQCVDLYQGDFTPILSSMRLIRDNLNETLTNINQSANQVASGSNQVSSGAQALSQGATEQASAVEELAATINEISEQIKQTAAHAADARDKTTESGKETMRCNEQMQDMIHAMDEISSKSNEIGKIIKTIEDIAFQTNILALNAAVEAARAGAAGKGFAVVADEVRNLAGKSAEASKNTASLIEGTITAVNRGTEIAAATANSLGMVTQGAQGVASTVDKIADAAEHQAASVAQVTQGIDQISSVVQTNSATAEQSAAASEELSGQAQILKDLVSRFDLLEQESAQIAQPAASPQLARTHTPRLTSADKY